MKTWNSYYQRRPQDISNILLHWQYLLMIFWFQPKYLLEIGCGPAQHALFIKKVLPGVKVYLLDKDQKLLEKVVLKNKKDISNYWLVDALTWRYLPCPVFDLVVSQGLIEHFTDQQIVKLIENFRLKAKKLLFSVPSGNYPTLDYGDEILRSAKEYKAILSTVEKIKFRVVPCLDLGLRTKLLKIRTKKSNWRETIRALFFESNHLLIEIAYEKTKVLS